MRVVTLVPCEKDLQPANATGVSTRKIVLVWRDELDTLPDVEWLVDGFLPVDSLNVLVGGFGTGKTFVVLDLALSVATGLPWHGRSVRKGRVVYVATEGLRGLKARTAAWEAARGVTVGRDAIAFVPETVGLLYPADVDALVRTILDEMPGGTVLVVFDTLARSIAGADENSARDMGLAVEAADRLKRETGAAILLVHHTGKDGRYRGSSALPGAADSVVKVTKSRSLVTLHCDKMKDAEPFDTFGLRLVPSCDSLALQLDTGTTKANCPLGEKAQRAVEALQSFGEAGASWSGWRKASGLDKDPFNNVLRKLETDERVCRDGKVWRLSP